MELELTFGRATTLARLGIVAAVRSALDKIDTAARTATVFRGRACSVVSNIVALPVIWGTLHDDSQKGHAEKSDDRAHGEQCQTEVDLAKDERGHFG